MATATPLAVSALTALLARCGVVTMDARDLPVEVTVSTDAGVRHFYGGTIEAALMLAEGATRAKERA